MFLVKFFLSSILSAYFNNLRGISVAQKHISWQHNLSQNQLSRMLSNNLIWKNLLSCQEKLCAWARLTIPELDMKLNILVYRHCLFLFIYKQGQVGLFIQLKIGLISLKWSVSFTVLVCTIPFELTFHEEKTLQRYCSNEIPSGFQ